MNRYEDFWQVTEAALRFSCAILRLSCTVEQRQKLMQEYLRLKPYLDVRDALAALRLNGKRLLILSNGSPGMLRPVVETAGLVVFFSKLLSVDAVKVYKPSPLVYDLAIEATGSERKAIGFVSSNYWDVAGAAAFGFQTFWINRMEVIPDELGVKPGAILSTLAELPALCGHAS